MIYKPLMLWLPGCLLLSIGLSVHAQGVTTNNPGLGDSLAYGLNYGINNALRYDLDFSLDLSRLEMELDTGNTRFDATQKRYGVSLYNPYTTPDMTYGLLLGSSKLSLDDDTAAANLPLDGYYLGVGVRADLFDRPRLRFEGQYLYQEVRGSGNNQSVTVDWLEWHVGTSLRLPLSNTIGLIVAGQYVGVDADLRIRGDTDINRSLTLEARPQGQLTVEMLFPQEGRASLSFTRGNQQGIHLEFARKF